MRVNPVTSLTAGRWFCSAPLAGLDPPPLRGEYSQHPELEELRGGAVVDTLRRSLAGVFAQHFHEPSLGELPLQ